MDIVICSSSSTDLSLIKSSTSIARWQSLTLNINCSLSPEAADIISSTVWTPVSLPFTIIPTLSHINSISDIRWLETITHIFSLCAKFLRISRSSLIPAGSRPFVGSSRIKSFGLCSIAWATPKRWRIPREYLPTLSLILFFNPTISTTSFILFSEILPLIRAYWRRFCIPVIYL